MIRTAIGKFSKEKFNALINVRAATLTSIRKAIVDEGYVEVSTSSLVNLAGSCENPYASFTLNYYGREAHLSQSAQLQLEAIVIRLKRAVFTVNNSFRQEDYEDPDTPGRRLSEFTLIEPERPYEGLSPEEALNKIIATEEKVMKKTIEDVLGKNARDVELLAGDLHYLERILTVSFNKITYEEAIKLLNGNNYYFGSDLGTREEKEVLAYFNGVPTFITHYPAKLKFFNMKRTCGDQKAYSVDLLMPRLGETIGGGIREENGEKIRQYLLESKIAQFLVQKGLDPLEPFMEYLSLFREERAPLRGGFGIGFERFVGFLLNSNDILETISYRSLQPSRG